MTVWDWALTTACVGTLVICLAALGHPVVAVLAGVVMFTLIRVGYRDVVQGR